MLRANSIRIAIGGERVNRAPDMNCPRCNVALDGHKYRDLEVDHCPNCRGLWLDFDEMDLLEDSANKEEVLKGTRDYARRPGDLPCPHCDALMDVFNYRAYNLPIEHCPNNHGYWLDKGEEDRVLELMKQRAHDLRRSESAEVQWARFMERGAKRGGLLDRIKDLFT